MDAIGTRLQYHNRTGRPNAPFQTPIQAILAHKMPHSGNRNGHSRNSLCFRHLSSIARHHSFNINMLTEQHRIYNSHRTKSLSESFCTFTFLHYLCGMVFYFSGTGNTRWVAEAIAKATGERLIPIANEPDGGRSYTLAEGERIGFCFPIHGWQPPAIVRKFIGGMSLNSCGGHYCYAVCTCGDNAGKAMDLLDSTLAQKGLKTDSVFSVIMPNTYVCLPFMDTDKPAAAHAKLQNATMQANEAIAAITQRKRGMNKVVTGPLPRLLTYVIGAAFNRRMVTDKPFSVDIGTCIKCGKCATACPTGNIAWSAGNTPQWSHTGKCTCCMACYHHCPQHAIRYGRCTASKGQYFFGKAQNKETHT